MSKCEYIDRCPSASGWCRNEGQLGTDCIPFILMAYKNDTERIRAETMKMVKVKAASSGLRPCYVDGKKALFHRWTDYCYVSPSKYFAKRYEGLESGEAEKEAEEIGALAIVEYEDGTVERVFPEDMRFVPGIMNEYNFMEGSENETGNATD